MELELLIPFPRDKIADFVVLCAVLCCSVVSNSATPWPTRFLCPWEFSRPEYWSGYPCPPPGGLPTPGIKPSFPPLQEDSLPIEPLGKTSQYRKITLASGQKRQRRYKKGLISYQDLMTGHHCITQSLPICNSSVQLLSRVRLFVTP